MIFKGIFADTLLPTEIEMKIQHKVKDLFLLRFFDLRFLKL